MTPWQRKIIELVLARRSVLGPQPKEPEPPKAKSTADRLYSAPPERPAVSKVW
jgi:hypothetical protein